MLTQWQPYDTTEFNGDDNNRPAYPHSLCPYFQIFDRTFFFFLADAPPISQNKAVSKANVSIIHLVRTVCELTFSIVQTHYTRMTLFCLCMPKSSSIKDRKTFFPKTMHHMCCFRWCQRVLSWTVVVWSEFVSLVLWILLSLRQFRAATYHRQLQTRHIGRWLTSVKFWCKVDIHWFNKLFWPIRTGCILQPRKWLEKWKRQPTITPHQGSTISFAGNKLTSFMSRFPYFLETVSVFWEIWAYICTASRFPY